MTRAARSSGKKARKPPPRRRPAPRARRVPELPAPTSLQYKVVELSTVDESALERTVNAWTAQGWALETVQFAMREASKRPAMAFVFFTREGPALDPALAEGAASEPAHAAPALAAAPDPWARLAALASGGDDP